jgi:hypothetical protein
MKCLICGLSVESLWRDFEAGDLLCGDCLDARYEEE